MRRDALCGGFLSWRSAERLGAIGVHPRELGGHPATKLALIAGKREATAPLPAPGYGLSRRALDSALRARAVADGATLVIDRARTVRPGMVEGESREWPRETIFLATGKHDVRGEVETEEERAVRERCARDDVLARDVHAGEAQARDRGDHCEAHQLAVAIAHGTTSLA